MSLFPCPGSAYLCIINLKYHVYQVPDLSGRKEKGPEN